MGALRIFDEETGMIVYLVRHAESAPRDHLSYEEGTAVGLSLFGRWQATLLAKKLALLGIQKIVSSPLARARETADAICKATGVSLALDDRFAEHVPSRTLTGVAFKEAKKRTRQEKDFIPQDGESFNHAAERFIKGLKEAVTGNNPACIVSHALVMQDALMVLFSLKVPPILDEASITKLSYENGKFSLVFINNAPSFFADIARRMRRRLKARSVWS